MQDICKELLSHQAGVGTGRDCPYIPLGLNISIYLYKCLDVRPRDTQVTLWFLVLNFF